MTEREALCWRIRRRAEALQAGPLEKRFPVTLKGMCAICTIALQIAFARRGWPCRAMYGKFFPNPEDYKSGRGHCWLEDCDFIYDLTATQFGLGAVEIISIEDERYGLRTWMVDLDTPHWKYAPINQRPSEELVAMLLEGEDERIQTG